MNIFSPDYAPVFHQGLDAQVMLRHCRQDIRDAARQSTIETDSAGREYVVNYSISILPGTVLDIPERDDSHTLRRALPVDGKWLLDEHYDVICPLFPQYIDPQIRDRYLKFNSWPCKTYNIYILSLWLLARRVAGFCRNLTVRGDANSINVLPRRRFG